MGTTNEERNLRDLVHRARDEAGLTQEGLAERIGMSQRWVSALEGGEVAHPRMATLHRLADALKLDLTDVLIAANLAKTRADARRLIDEAPIPPSDPRREIMRLLGDADLTEERANTIKRMIRGWIAYDREHGQRSGDAS